MRILSWNLLRRDGACAQDVARLVEAHRPDLVLLQEAEARLDALPDLVGGCWARHSLPRRGHGLAAWSPLPFPAPELLDLPHDPKRGAPRFAILVRTPELHVATVHLSHGQFLLRQQLAAIRQWLDFEPGSTAIIGDFNAMGPTLLKGYRDVGPWNPTHLAKGLLPVRVDRCLVRGGKAVAARVLGAGPSDHKPILIDLRLP